jgi:hypothetical protein
VLTLLIFLLAYALTYMGTLNVKAQGAETYVNKPVYPIKISASEIPIGNNYTLVYNLQANVTYHGYFYGKWINNGSEPKTDYDVYVYNPLGELESIHTEAAGLPEHLGDNVTYPYFTPKYSGNYTFVIRNDPRESQAAEAGTFMMIQHVETNKWYEQYIQGTVNDQPVQNTSWAFEFQTSSKNVEVKIMVPDTLDMYEARLYLMANPSQGKGTTLNNVSLAWEPGLYGNRSGVYGGYNLDSKQYRGLAYASCEYPGQDMFINYTSPYDGESLYHLVLIGEAGEGIVSFAVKTDFQGPSIDITNAPQKVFPEQQVNMTFRINGKTELNQVQMQYTNDNWNTSQPVTLDSNQLRVYTASIPRQPAGTRIRYNITATDVVDNTAQYQGSYAVKYATAMNFTLKTKAWALGRNITISGSIQPTDGNLTVKVTFKPYNGSMVQKIVHTLANGTFFVSFAPNATGKWTVEAECLEDNTHFGSVNDSMEFSVVPENDFFEANSMYIYAGMGMMMVAVIAVVVIRRRRG